VTAQINCFDQLIELFPHDGYLKLCKLSRLSDRNRDERLALLAELCADTEADPLFRLRYAQELSDDPRENRRATAMLRRVLRRRPVDAGAFYVLANILWGERRFMDALHLYRFSFCLNDKDEQLAASYFIASRYFVDRATDEEANLLTQHPDGRTRRMRRTHRRICAFRNAPARLSCSKTASSVSARAR
jgi:hypothetical protein